MWPFLVSRLQLEVHGDTCVSDYLPILLENSTDELSKRTQSWNLGKSNWDGFKTLCFDRLTPEANKNNEGNILYLYEHTVKPSWRIYTQKLYLYKIQ